MTLNDLKKLIPEQFHDSIILLHLPHKEDDEDLPLIEVIFDQVGTKPVQIILYPDW